MMDSIILAFTFSRLRIVLRSVHHCFALLFDKYMRESEIPYHAYSGSKVEVSGRRLYHFVVADWRVATE